MRVVFRVDASLQIGTGHVMRCLTLAEALRNKGAQVEFICRRHKGHLTDRISSQGFNVHVLKATEINVKPASPGNLEGQNSLPHSQWLAASQTQDADECRPLLDAISPDWLIVDHYALDIRWESMLRDTAKKIMVIDDIADRQHDCDILLDQNLYTNMETRYSGEVPAQCQLLLGPQYALLREEFKTMREQVQPRNGPVERLLIFFGGVDIDNFTGHAIEALFSIGVPDLHVDVVIGASHPCREKIEAECKQYGFTCHVQTSQMAELMALADLAIGSGGSAVWERCCLGLPALTICMADNQQDQVADAAREGLLYSPEIQNNLHQMLQRHTKAMIENGSLRWLISHNSMQAVDGRGVERVIRKLGYTGECRRGDVDVRSAVVDDAVLVLPWRNNEVTRRYFFDPTPVSLETHLDWWGRSLVDPKCALLLGRLKGREVGVLRYDFNGSRQAKVSIYLDPEMTGFGLGEHLLRAGQNWLLQNHPEINTILAEVILGNVASSRSFLAAGFQEQHKAYVWKGC